jgi:hypothetical protein
MNKSTKMFEQVAVNIRVNNGPNMRIAFSGIMQIVIWRHGSGSENIPRR